MCLFRKRRINTGSLAHLQPADGSTILFHAKVGKVDCRVMPDSGSTHVVGDAGFVERAGLADQVLPASAPLTLTVAGNTEVTLTHALATPTQTGNMRSHIVMYVMPSLL